MHLQLSTWPRRLLARPWLLAFVPFNAATSGFGVMLPLWILLRLHGSLLDIALAAVLFNVAVILASVLWGYLSDRSPNRRAFLAINFGGFAVVYALLGTMPSLALLFVLYTIIGLIAPAGASASNLLVLEQFSEEERPAAFASFQEMSIVGAIAGVLAGYFWLAAGGALAPLLVVFAALAGVAAIAVELTVPDTARPLSSAHVADHPASLASRLRHSVALRAPIPFFPGWHHRSGTVRRLGSWVSTGMRREIPLIFAAGFLFNFAANLFNTSYTPYLESVGLATSAIFLVNFANNLTQGFCFPASGALARREGHDRLVHQATYTRALGYLAVAGLTLTPLAVGTAFAANAAIYAVFGAAIAFYSTASSLILFRALHGRDSGAILGWNSALGGVAAVSGAFLSGVLSYFFSYRLTFLVSAAALLVSLPLWSAAALAYAHRRGERLAGPSPAGAAAPGISGTAPGVPGGEGDGPAVRRSPPEAGERPQTG